ncbi:MAG: ABC transporter permease, partial [Bacteroidales bacterium]
AVALSVFFNSTLKNGRNSVSGAMVGSVTYDFSKIAKANLEKGRYFTQEEDKDGAPIVIIGYEIAQKLFKDDNPIGKRIKIRSTSAEVIGVFEKQGESMVNVFQTDESVLIPLNFGRYMVNIKMVDNSIFVTPKAGVKQQDLVDEITNLMRAQRRLKPNEKNDFSIIKMTFLLDMVQSVFSILNLVGWVIAGFSLLIGGFGIANIMFVSVKERTNIIGIQKALGAKKYVIMTQFLVEAAFLAIAGGLIGIIMVSGVIFAVPANAQFTMQLSLANIINGVAIASIIGLISGLIPAWLAATLNPVDAINSK